MSKARITLAMLASAALFAPQAMAEEALQLDQAYKLVMEQNPQIQTYKARIIAAEGNRLQQSLMPNPEAVLEIENFGGDEPRDGLEQTEYTFGVQQQIEIAGKRSKRESVASVEKEQAEQEALAGIQSTLAQTKAAYMRVAIAKERIALAARRAILADHMLETVKKRIGAAKAAEIQQTRSEIEQSAAKVEMRQARTEFFAAETALANLMGATKLEHSVSADFKSLPEIPEQQAIMEALQNAPAALMGELLVSRQENALELAKANAVPDPTLGLGVRRFSEDDGSAFLASLSIPIPAFNRNQGTIAQAKADLLAAESEKRRQHFDLARQGIELWQEFSTAREEVIQYQDEILPSAQRAFDQAQGGFDQGAFTFLDLIDAQRTLFDAQQEYLKALSNFYQTNTQIDMLTGTYAEIATASLKEEKE